MCVPIWWEDERLNGTGSRNILSIRGLQQYEPQKLLGRQASNDFVRQNTSTPRPPPDHNCRPALQKRSGGNGVQNGGGSGGGGSGGVSGKELAEGNGAAGAAGKRTKGKEKEKLVRFIFIFMRTESTRLARGKKPMMHTYATCVGVSCEAKFSGSAICTSSSSSSVTKLVATAAMSRRKGKWETTRIKNTGDNGLFCLLFRLARPLECCLGRGNEPSDTTAGGRRNTTGFGSSKSQFSFTTCVCLPLSHCLLRKRIPQNVFLRFVALNRNMSRAGGG